MLVALAHTPWVRALVLNQLTAALRQRTGFDFTASRLDYDVLRLTADVSDLRISRPGDAGAPVLLADPTFNLSAQTPGILWPDVSLPHSTAEASISRTGIRVTRSRTDVGRGWVEATG